MYRIIRWYNQNRKLFWKIVLFFVIIIVVIQLLQKITVYEQKKKQENAMAEIKQQTNFDSIKLETNRSPITGGSISNKQKENLKILDEFVEYCNQNKIGEAYSLISDDCKEEMYPNISEFQTKYYNKIFNGKQKNILVENWVGNIYKVKFKDDAISTGLYNSEEFIEDYITIIEDENKNIKININEFIERKDIKKQNQENGITVKILEKNQYMKFETLVFEVTNKSDNTILLNDINDSNALYLEDDNGINYSAYMHELSEAQLKVYAGETKKITIKFYNKYGSSKRIENVVFSKIVLNYDIYKDIKTTGVIEGYKNYGKVSINL